MLYLIPSSVVSCVSVLWAARRGVERVRLPFAESSYFASFADSSCCVALSASELALSAKTIQKVTITFVLFQHVQLFECRYLS